MNKQKFLTITIIFAVFLSLAGLSFNASAASPAAASPPLGAASSFSVLAAKAMSAANKTSVSGDLGLSPGLAVSRTGPWTVGGSQYFGPKSLAGNAQSAALGAFNNLAGQTSNGAWSLNPKPAPGVWTDANATFVGTLTLTGGINAVWVFQIGSDMTFSGNVIMGGNAQACNVFWQIGRDATIAAGSDLSGTLIASRDVTIVSGARVNGRIISLNGSLTTDGNSITGPSCASAPGPTSTTAPGATNTTAPITQATATLLPGVSGLPSTGGGPIQNEPLPWSLMFVAGLVAAVLILGVGRYNRTRLLK